MLRRTRSWRTLLPLVLALLVPAWLWAQVPQTITLDGVNDFDPSNLLDADGGDTQYTPIDLGDIFVTNDAVNLYLGFDQDQDGWASVQLGIAIDVGTPDGGTTDPWGRQLEWSLATDKPDFMFYVNLDNDWEAGYYWDGTAWQEITPAGTGSLGWQIGTGFKELGILLATLGVGPGDPVNVELWTTQDSPTKGPLDAAANDGSQLSVPGTTIWDVTSPIPMIDYLAYTVQNAADNDPPQVVKAVHYVDSQVDVTFNEPVDPVTAQVAGNYSVTGATVTAAAVDGGSPNVVHLTLAADIGPSASLYHVVVSDVQDLAGNPVGAQNEACFFLKNILFRGRMSQYLRTGSSPPDEFTVEGSQLPLTWALCDNAQMTDADGDSIYEWDGDFCVVGDCDSNTAAETLEWKFVHNCTTYEPLPGNRVHEITMATGAYDTLDVWWDDEDPTQFTTHDIDVEFFVDLNVAGFTAGDTIAVNGTEAPLSWDVPSLTVLADDGVAPDVTAGDGIYAARVRFPAGTHKNVEYKFLQNGEYECASESNRQVFLNDALFGTADTGDQLTLPVVHFDRCHTTWRAVEVVFRLDVNGQPTPVGPSDVVTVNGTPSNSEPVSFSWDIPSLNVMHDDGIAPDDVAGDGIYAAAVAFADSSWIHTEYKYLVNDQYECGDQGNRSFELDADNHDDAGNPQILPVDALNQCHTTGAGDVPAAATALDQNHPNPFNPQTEIRFTVHRAGTGSLLVFDVRGQRVRTLLRGRLETGPHAVTWNGRADDGSEVPSGVYFYQLRLNGECSVRKMMLVR